MVDFNRATKPKTARRRTAFIVIIPKHGGRPVATLLLRASSVTRVRGTLRPAGRFWNAPVTSSCLSCVGAAEGRTGPIAGLLRGLIKLAAAGVKIRQGIPDQAATFADAAARAFEAARPALAPDSTISIDGLLRLAGHVREHGPTVDAGPSRTVAVVFESSLARALAG